MTTTSSPNPTRTRAWSLSAVAAAFLVGVLVAALVMPERDEVVLREGAAGTPGSLAGGGSAAAGSAAAGRRTAGVAARGGGSDGSGGGAGGAAAAGSGVAAGVPGAPGGGSGGSGGGAGGGRSTARGVDATTVTVGFGLPDLGAIAALGPGYDQGDPRQHVEAILAELRATGRLPVHGRDIVPVYSSYNILSPEAQRATCERFGNDDSVFAVVAIHDFGAGAECVAAEYGLPLFTSDGQPDPVYERSGPNLFTMQMSADRLFRNYVAWADQGGYLDGKKIGVYYPSDPELAQLVQRSVLEPLERLGHDVVSEVQTAEPNTGGPTDSVAVQRFRTDGVEVAVLVVSALAKTNFFNQAESQLYRPTYLENDAGFSTTDTATSTYPRAHFDGTRAFTGMRFGELRSGLPEPAEAAWCRAAIKNQTGNDIPVQGRDAEYIAANQSCDEILTVLHGLEQAGPELTAERFIAGVETIQDRPTGIHGNVGFGPGRHDGVRTWREIRWHGDCTCWKVASDMRPLLVD
ncbi:MAG TPA: hypothetical protein VFU14_20520 [Acidimicrobiales bacterium]|nr:hypothetical protein [Acidimicrobiales bacterium]